MNFTQVKSDIIWNSYKFNIFLKIESILHPCSSTTAKAGDEAGNGRGNPKQEKNKEQTFEEYNVTYMKRGKTFFKEVIQRHGLHNNSITNPMFKNTKEECARFVFIGICNCKCRRKASHTPLKGNRETKLIKFKDDCLARYNMSKTKGVQDFQ